MTLYGALTRWGYINTHCISHYCTVHDTYTGWVKKTDTFAANLNNKGVSFFLLALYSAQLFQLRFKVFRELSEKANTSAKGLKCICKEKWKILNFEIWKEMTPLTR
jgi:hypothetical protein